MPASLKRTMGNAGRGLLQKTSGPSSQAMMPNATARMQPAANVAAPSQKPQQPLGGMGQQPQQQLPPPQMGGGIGQPQGGQANNMAMATSPFKGMPQNGGFNNPFSRQPSQGQGGGMQQQTQGPQDANALNAQLSRQQSQGFIANDQAAKMGSPAGNYQPRPGGFAGVNSGDMMGASAWNQANQGMAQQNMKNAGGMSQPQQYAQQIG